MKGTISRLTSTAPDAGDLVLTSAHTKDWYVFHVQGGTHSALAVYDRTGSEEEAVADIRRRFPDVDGKTFEVAR
jgi:hypothetical protein